jgi:hypothetical protein
MIAIENHFQISLLETLRLQQNEQALLRVPVLLDKIAEAPDQHL